MAVRVYSDESTLDFSFDGEPSRTIIEQHVAGVDVIVPVAAESSVIVELLSR